MARYFLLSLVFALVSTATFAQTSIAGKVTDADSGEELIAANVTLYKEGVLITGVATDFEGNYSINTDPGTYDVEISYIGYPTNRINGVIVNAGQANKLDVQLGAGDSGINLDEIVVTDYKVPLIEQDNTSSGATVTSEDIRKFATKNITSVAAATAGLSQLDEGDGVTVRGSRSNATDIYVDGIRVTNSQVQEADVEQLQVITGGIPAYYGDVTGGVISITTKGPSAKFSGGIEGETSEFLDPYGYNQLRANVSGPILKKKDTGQSILGFRFSGAYTYRKDDDPPATNIYKVKDEKIAELEADPIQDVGIGFPNGSYLTNEDIEIMDYRPDEASSNLNLTGKIDARLSKSIDISITGTYVDAQNKFTPTSGGRHVWRLMNSHNNPTTYTDRYRGNFRFRHRLGGGGNTNVEDAASQKSSFIQNAQYTLQFGYEKGKGTTYDPRHEDRLFDYGHYGKYNWSREVGIDSMFNVDIPGFEYFHAGYSPVFGGYDPSTAANPVIANYNPDLGDDVSNVNLYYLPANSILPSGLTSIWSGLHTNVGTVYNLFNKNESDLITANATVNFDLLPGGSEKGRHSIQLGMLYEQRFTRNYSVNPRRLWEIGQQQVNRHILGLDSTDILRMDVIGFDTVPIYNTFLDDRQDLRFYRAVRGLSNGLTENELLDGLHAYVNINSLDPSQLSLDMFAPSELTDTPNIIGFYGYDYLGNKLDNSVTFEDFFTSRDPNDPEVRAFLVPVNKPNYLAAFIQDKFTFRDIIFRLGLRVDRYDANTKVLKDPYSLYEIIDVKDFIAHPDIDISGQYPNGLPGAIGDDFKVYTDGSDSDRVKAFRNGDTWYTADGTAVNSSTLIFGGAPVFPRLRNPTADIKADGFNISDSFEDYEPQINWMPRLAFSFPISDAANFFAHYDILVQRPPSNSIVSPLSYYYFYDRTPENNPNLRPERTVDYEVGFQQKLSNSSAIKIAAYYKEMRDMIQLQTYLNVPVIGNYQTFSNQDYGTVKGFTFQYDLRRTGNVSANINYTLQFADGTGSNAESQRGLTSRGNLRYLYPLDFDERHRIVAAIDYRYGTGKRYNGPRWFGKDIFAQAGINVQAIAVSGRPFTAKELPSRFGGEGTIGSINGARKPWNFTINLRADKTFDLTKPGAKRAMNINLYFRVQNLLDTRNIVNVYPASGSPSDDGFLASPFGQGDIANQSNPQLQTAFVDAYNWALDNPTYFSLPRRMFLGAIFSF